MKHVVITGTSRGIGLELALLFAGAGHRVLALSRKVSDKLVGNRNITCLPIDLENSEDFKKVSDFVESDWKTVDCVIQNAGAIALKPFEQTTPDDFLRIYKVNVFAVARLTQTLLPFMQKGSHVVGISSMGGIQGSVKFAGLSAYSSSKGALITLMELLAEEYRDRGIAFNTLALGAVQTEMLAEAFPGYEAPTTAEAMAAYIYDFALTGNAYFNGKILQVSSTTP
jgi:NAD(P)-dependent dehydrogenase (short-subunit alcohol dehydrogenase family)